MLEVTLFSRANCHLCEQAKADLQAIQREIPHRLFEIDIDSDPAIRARYHTSIPVVQVGPYTLKAPFSRAELRMTLGAARDARSQNLRLAQQPIAPIERRGPLLVLDCQPLAGGGDGALPALRWAAFSLRPC